MASSTIKVDNPLIKNIEMDHYEFSAGPLATVGVGPCICFLIILNDGQQVFLEHRSDIFFASNLSLKNTSLCLENLAEHVSEVLPTSKIT